MLSSNHIINESGYFVSRLSRNFQEARPYPELPPELKNFIFRFQTDCVVECCGMSAFNFPEPSALNPQWQADEVIETLLAQEREKVSRFPADILIINQLNQLMYKDEFLRLLLFLEDGLREARK